MSADQDGIPLLIGCYTGEAGGNGHGIAGTAVRADGSFEPVTARTDALASPTFLAKHPRLPVVYAVSELSKGILTTYEAGGAELLQLLDSRPTGGSEPCHVAVDADAGLVAVANYADGSLSIFTLDAHGVPVVHEVFQHTGSGPHPGRQEAAHCHQVLLVDGIEVTDLGADRVRRYAISGRQVSPAPDAALRAGSGPRHVAVDGAYRYVVDELQPGVTAYYVDPESGQWEQVGQAQYPGDSYACLPSHVLLHNGFLYVANRGADTISVIKADEGELSNVAEVPTGGAWPRHFELVGGTLVVANQHSDTLTSLLLEGGDPVPSLTPHRASTGAPSCVIVVDP